MKRSWDGTTVHHSGSIPNEIQNNQWLYYDGNSWRTQQDEVSVECLCKTLHLSLKNGAESAQGFREGYYDYYQITNGKPSWVSDNHAIWYLPDYFDWAIGARNKIGGNWAGIQSIGDQGRNKHPENVPNNVWVYAKNGQWQWSQMNNEDISVTCLGNSEVIK